jgi:hypothetical protein
MVQKPEGLTTFGRSDGFNYFCLSIKFLTPNVGGQLFRPVVVRCTGFSSNFNQKTYDKPKVIDVSLNACDETISVLALISRPKSSEFTCLSNLMQAMVPTHV